MEFNKKQQEIAMSTRTGLRVGIAAVGLALMLAGCARAPPEQVLRETIGQLQEAIETRDIGALKQILADDFIGADGLDREGATRLAQMMFLQHRDVGVTTGPLHVNLLPDPSAPDHATVRFTAALTGGSGATLPDVARVYEMETGWRLEGNDWRLTSATWTP